MAKRKEPGMMTDISQTIGSSFRSVNNSAGLVSDTFEFARESMKPILVEARIETVETVIQGVKTLVDLGMEANDAKEYLVHGRIA